MPDNNKPLKAKPGQLKPWSEDQVNQAAKIRRSDDAARVQERVRPGVRQMLNATREDATSDQEGGQNE